MRLTRTLALGATVLALRRRLLVGWGGSPRHRYRRHRHPLPRRRRPLVGGRVVGGPVSAAALPSVRIGSDNFYESKLMAEIYAQVLEKAGYTVERNLGLGSRQERAPAFEAGQVDLVPEYVGSGLGYYDKTKITGDGEAEPRRHSPAIMKTKAGGAHGLRHHSGPGHQRRGRPTGHGRRSSTCEDGRPGSRPGPAQVGPAARLRQEPALLGRAEGLRHHVSAEAADRARRVQRPDRPGPSGQGDRHRDGSARRSRPSRSSASRCSKTTRRPSRPTTSPRSSVTTTWPRSRTRRPSRRCSTTRRPR